MKRIKGNLFALLLSALGAPLWAGSYTAASCNLSDVSAVIKGPLHTAVNGDTIIIPAGTCTWTSNLSISVAITLTGSGTANSGPSTFGVGTLNTIIVDNAGSSAPLIAASAIAYGQTFTLALLDIEPNSASTALYSPISVAGTCAAGGCPNIRVSNIGFGLTTHWNESGNGAPADWMIRADNVFGVIDHCTLPTGSAVELLNANLSAYLGVGGYGDNSWAQPDSFGGGNVLYMENNVVTTNQSVNDCDVNPTGGGIGGCRIAGRFNQITGANGFFSAFYGHGLDTDGRPQGIRQIEAYGNTVNCNQSSGCNYGMATFRSGTGLIFGNTMTVSNGGFYNNIAGIVVYRTVFTALDGWGACGGSKPLRCQRWNRLLFWDKFRLEFSSTTLTDSTKTWTTNQLVPNGAPYLFTTQRKVGGLKLPQIRRPH